jgi:7-carboxy-7-deazaguanine synthase
LSYSVKEIFYTLQGEGANAGRAAVFCRFAGCNLWSGQESDRDTAKCTFCDTDFVGTDGSSGGKYPTAAALADKVAASWGGDVESARFVVLTGGEPLLQVDGALIDALHANRFFIAVETNGTIAPPPGIDWVAVSPKVNSELLVTKGNEIKVVWPQTGMDLGRLEGLEFQHRYLQPLYGPRLLENTRDCVQLCMRRPRWRLSVQVHKAIGIP